MKFAAYIQATKDDFCLFEVCERLFVGGLNDFFFCVPDTYWSGRKTPQSDIDQVTAVMAKLMSMGAAVRFQMFEVDKYRAPGRLLVDIETCVRNDSLRWIRSHGFDHIIVVDGDELWISDYYPNLVGYVTAHSPGAVAFGMIPTIGLPGYPIEGATDMATVYVGPGVIFSCCRGPNTERFSQLPNVRGIIHFTATRRTMQEIIDKHRASGHYDDPSYDFEGWIANTLPHVKPGMRNAHMYRPYQIWPVVREWKHSELKEIPISLHKYLGIPSSYPILGT